MHTSVCMRSTLGPPNNPVQMPTHPLLPEYVTGVCLPRPAAPASSKVQCAPRPTCQGCEMALHDRQGRGSTPCLAIGWCTELLVVSVEAAALCRRACDRPHRTGPISGILDYFFELLNFDSGYFMTNLHLCVATCTSFSLGCAIHHDALSPLPWLLHT
jgi:hypothetical protein